MVRIAFAPRQTKPRKPNVTQQARYRDFICGLDRNCTMHFQDSLPRWFSHLTCRIFPPLSINSAARDNCTTKTDKAHKSDSSQQPKKQTLRSSCAKQLPHNNKQNKKQPNPIQPCKKLKQYQTVNYGWLVRAGVSEPGLNRWPDQ